MSKLRLHLGFTIPHSMVWAHFEGLTSARDMWILSGFSLTFWWVLSGSGVMVKKKKRGSDFPLLLIAQLCLGGEKEPPWGDSLGSKERKLNGLAVILRL
jgi:hypothetical protein